MGDRHCASTLGAQWDRPKFVVFRSQPSRRLREFPSTGLVLAITQARRRVPGWVHVGRWRRMVCDQRIKKGIFVWRRKDW
jgi:hypothetical protein